MDNQTPMSPEADGFMPPWAEWDFNEWETCTDTEHLLVREFQMRIWWDLFCFAVLMFIFVILHTILTGSYLVKLWHTACR